MPRGYVSRVTTTVVGLSVCVWLCPAADAQLTDVTQTPNQANAGIQKSLEEQIGAGQGDVMTPDSSLFLIQRDPFRAIRRGRQIFQRKFTTAQGVGPRVDDDGKWMRVSHFQIDRRIDDGGIESHGDVRARP